MAKFDPAVDIILDFEGGLSDDAADRGGITHWGISLAVLKGLGKK